MFSLLQILPFSKTDCFAALAGHELDVMSSLIEAVERTSETDDQRAYAGALKMKKSGLLKTPKDRLELFKNGRSLLESAISKNTANPEYRFLRLIIQEHAPKVVKYSNQISEDVKILWSAYESMPADVRQVFLKYAETSPSLKR